MDKRRVVLLLLVIVLSIFYTDTVKAKVAPGLEAVRSAAVTDAEEGFWKEIKDYLGLITRRRLRPANSTCTDPKRDMRRYWP